MKRTCQGIASFCSCFHFNILAHMTEWFFSQNGRWWRMRERESRVCSKDLIKPHHGMSYCDSRDQDRGVCVCSVQLWIISTLFLLWPTCTGRRIWELCPHTSSGLSSFTCYHRESARSGAKGSPYGEPYVGFKLSISAGDNLGHERHLRCTFLLNVQWLHGAAWLDPPCGLFADWCSLMSNFHLPCSYPGDVYSWSLRKTPISTFFPSLRKSYQPLLLLLSMGCHGYSYQIVWLAHEFV